MSLSPPARRRRLVPIFLVLLAALAAPTSVAAHAELVSTSPADGDVLSSAPDEVVAIFDEALNPARSSIDIRSGGSVLATGTVDAALPVRMVIGTGDLDPGEYTVHWAAAGADDHLDRGVFSFTIIEPDPEPTPSPSPERPSPERPSPTATAPASPSPEPTPGGGGGDPGEVGDVVISIVAALLIVALLGYLLLRRRAAPPSTR